MGAYTKREESAQPEDHRDKDLKIEVALVGALELVIPRWVLGFSA
jgi:hypothetical protein